MSKFGLTAHLSNKHTNIKVDFKYIVNKMKQKFSSENEIEKINMYQDVTTEH